MWTAEKIKALRKKGYNETQEEFARRLRISAAALRNWEQGVNPPIGPAEVLLDRLQEDLDEGKIRQLQPA